MAEYDIWKIYDDMEAHLLSSMSRNLMRHTKEEKEYGFDWEQWQAAKLREMRKFRKHNQSIIGKHTKNLPADIKQHLQNEYKQGLVGILGKHKELFGNHGLTKDLSEGFFSMDDEKIQALIDAVNNDLKEANHAALRMINDAYRQTIHRAAMFAANGVMTEKQAVQLAINDFAKQGLTCIKYKNGARHNIKEYAEMAVRTAEARAMLMGEGKARQELGETLVRISKHGTACPLCVPFENKVLIDDVYSGGTWENSKEDYERVPASSRASVRLMSEAMKAGLYHPRCRHGLGTYYVDLWGEKKPESIEENVNEWYNKEAKSNAKDTGKRYATGDLINLLTAEEIIQRFTYVDVYGTPHNPFDEGFKQLPIETQREIAAGIEYAQERFNVQELPNIITAKALRSGIIGEFAIEDGKRIIKFALSLKNQTSEAFGTAIHEMVHYIDDANKWFSESIYKEALKNLNLRANARETNALKARIVGIYNTKDINDASELLAYSIELIAIGRENKLAQEMYNIFVRRLSR